MSKPRLFIGSSVEALTIAFAIQQNLRHDAEVTVWDQGIFRLSSSSLDSLLETLDTQDFAVFVFSPDDLLEIRGAENQAVRDNVIFELGLFIGRLGKNRCFIVIPEDTDDLHIPTDLLGVTPGKYETNRSDDSHQAATGPACHSIREVIGLLGHRYIEPGSATTAKVEEVSDIDTPEIELGTEVTEPDDDANAVGDPDWFVHYQQEEYQESIEILEELIAKPEDVEMALTYKSWRARILYALDPDAGIAAFEEVFEEFKEDALPYLLLGFEQQEKGFQLRALETYQAGRTKKGYSTLITSQMSTILRDLGREAEMVELLMSALEEQPIGATHYIELSKHFIEKEMFSKAREILVDGLEHNPQNVELLTACASLIYDNFDKKEVLFIYNRLLKLHPNFADYLTLRGNTYLDLELNALAMRDYKSALEIESEAAWIHSNIGNLYNNRGFYNEAVNFLRKAVELDPNSQYAHERLSHSLKALNDELDKLAKLERAGTQAFLSWEPPAEVKN